jgi:hypothetical protein
VAAFPFNLLRIAAAGADVGGARASIGGACACAGADAGAGAGIDVFAKVM